MNDSEHVNVKSVNWFAQLTVGLILLLTNSDCKKIESIFSKCEYMDKYLGIWDFHYSWSRTRFGPINIYSGDSFEFTGAIKSGASRSQITIESSSVLNKKVEFDGRILETCRESAQLHWSVSCSGYFQGDSIFRYSTYEKSPPNQVTEYITELSGRKQDKKVKSKAPMALTAAAAGVTTSTATLNGIVNANFLSTQVSFEYGKMSGGYVFIISAIPAVISGSGENNVSCSVSGLASGLEYNFRIKAVNTFGTTYGKEVTFTTAK
jgi:hypothetical protein